jgi:hypothetical protein
MRIRSTGLGKTELIGYIEGIKRVEDYLVLSMRTAEPVRWHVRVAMTPKDLRQMLKAGLKGSNLAYVLANLWKNEEPAPLKEY